MPLVMIANNPTDPAAWTGYDVAHVGSFLKGHYGQWPATARIYANSVSKENDITPFNLDGIRNLENYGRLWVVVYPATGVEVAIGIGVVALAASIAAIALIPEIKEIKTSKERQTSQFGGSPNNQISDRQNKARPEGRIPDIYGTVLSVPDLVMAPYTVIEDHREVELGYYCIGRGEHFATTENVRDGDTRIDQITGASAHIFGPGNAPTGAGPHSGDILAIGDPIDEPVKNVYQIRAVNGQALNPVNTKTVYGVAKLPDVNGDPTIQFLLDFYRMMGIGRQAASEGFIMMPYTRNTEEVTDRIQVGDLLWIFLDPDDMPASSAAKPDLQTLDDLSNAPTVTSIEGETVPGYVEIRFSVPTALQTEFDKIPAYIAGLSATSNIADTFNAAFAEVTSLEGWEIGEFFIDSVQPLGSSNEQYICNFVAPGGYFVDDGVTIQKDDCAIAVTITPADVSGVASGTPEVFTGVLLGSDVAAGQRGITVVCEPTFTGRALIKARRLTRRRRKHELPSFIEAVNYPGQTNFAGRIVDEIRWVSAYQVAEPPNISFGNVTTVYTRTVLTDAVARLRTRELNIQTTRMIRTWNGSTFAGPVAPNANAENVIMEILADPALGNRSNDEIDFQGIEDAFVAVRDYFRTSITANIATEFHYTFDDVDLSTEDMLTAVATACFGQIYRQGNVIKCRADIDTDNAVCAFNSRNILPGTISISHTFGPPSENDSIEVEYVDLDDNSLQTVKVPIDGSGVAPRQLKIVGTRSEAKAFMHAYRGYQRLRHQRQALEMSTTQEAGLLLTKDRILVQDITKLDQQHGEVLEVDGLNLRLSQTPDPAVFVGGGVNIFLQHTDGTVEGIPVTLLSGRFQVALGSAPSSTLVTDASQGVPTIYNIVRADESMPFAYQVAEVNPQDNMVFDVSAINYSHEYYLGDALEAWFISSSIDQAPYQRNYTVTGSIGTAAGPDGKTMMNVVSGSFTRSAAPLNLPSDNLVQNTSYSIAGWVVKDSGSTGTQFLVDVDSGSSMSFGFTGTATLTAGHGGASNVTQAILTDELVHVAVTYDFPNTTMRLYVNGVEVDSATSVAVPPTVLQYRYVSGYVGLVRDLQRWKRLLSPTAVMENFLKGR